MKRISLLCALALTLAASSAMAAGIGGLLAPGSSSNFNFVEANPLEYSGVVNLTIAGNVQSGYVILRETLGPSDSTRWSDVLVIENSGHKPTNTAGDVADRAALISDVESGITDADLAQLGNVGLPIVTVADINAALAAGFATKRFETAFNYAPCTAWKPANDFGGFGFVTYTVCSEPSIEAFPGVSPAILIVLGALLAFTGVIVLRRKLGGGPTPA